MVGVEDADTDEIFAGLSQHPPEGFFFKTYATFDPVQLALDRRRIQSFLKDRGYLSARVVDAKVSPFGGGVRVDFIVDEGPAFSVGALRFTETSTANVDLDVEAIGHTVAQQNRFEVGATFIYERFEATKQGLVQALMNRGYAHAEVTGRVVVLPDETAVEVAVEVDTGPLVRFGRIDIDPGPLPEEAIRARLAFETGDVYDPAAVAISEARIYELDLVGVVSFYTPTKGRPNPLDLRIEVRPGKKNELRIGLGFARQNPNYQIRARIGYARRYFFDPRVRASTEVRPAVLYQPADATLAFGVEASAGVRRQDLFLPRLDATAEVQYNLLQFEAYSTLGPVVRVSFERPYIDDRLRLSAGLGFKYLGFPRVEGVIPRAQYSAIGLPDCSGSCLDDGEIGGANLLTFEPAVTFDGRDDPIRPSIGVYGRLQLELGRAVDPSQTTWMKITPEVRGYLPLGTPRVVWAARTRLGAKLLPGAPIPATQRYFGGGSESQRGFTIRQLSPFFGEGAEAVPVGGESLWEVSTEIRALLFKIWGMWIGIVAFVDAADVGADFTALDFLEPHVAAGGGVRWYTPIGPLRVDVGYRLNRVAPGIEPGGTDRIALHLSLGEAF